MIPILFAPRDGRRFLAYDPLFDEFVIAFYHNNRLCTEYDRDDKYMPEYVSLLPDTSEVET